MIPRDSWTSKEKHRIFLENSPFIFSKNLSKKQRLAAGLPPNTYNERVYELTMNPHLGYPTSEKLIAVQNNLKEIRKKAKAGELTARAPGETVSNSWQSVGPNNAGGRTRAALFDLSDTDFDKVFAGGVSGGLWVNQDIDNASEVSWSRVNGVPGNLAVTTIVQDKNEPTLLFVGTGESYTTGDAIGNGIYRSTDGGQNWSMVLGTGTSSASTTSSTSGSPPNTTFWVNGNFYVNDMQFWDPTPANTANDDEIIFAALGFAYNSNFDGPNTSTYMGYNSHGLYKSTDKGLNWTRFNTLYSTTGTGYLDAINDIEVASDNTIWISTTNDVYGSESGRFYSSSDGTNFTLHNPSFPSISNKSDIRRVEIEPSGQNSGTFYILINYNNQADIYKTVDGFSTLTQLSEPADEQPADIAAGDFTRGQAFYDLEVEVDPTNDDIVYVGGINWFKSTDGGNNWNQMSDWNGQPTRPYSRTHADQHGLYFRPNSSFNQAVVVNDGGVAFVSNLASATTNDVFTTQEKDFITTQFYSVAQTPEGFASDFIIGGTQDNGTHKIDSPTNAPANSTEISGGDGGYAYVDQVSSTYYISNYIYNNILYRFDINTNTSSFLDFVNSGDSDYNEGDFINPGALDSNLDILYTNGTKNGTVKIKRFKDLDNSSPPPPDYVPSLATLDASPSAFEVSPFTTTSTLLLVGLDSGKLVKIENAQGSSPSATDLTNNLGSISDIQFGTDENKIFLTYYNYGVNNVYYSSDGGSNWTQKDGNLPDIPVWTIQHNPFDENEVIIGTGLGVWQTDNFLDSNPNWTQSYNGMSDVAVHDITFRGSSALSNRVIAGSYGRGIFTGSFQDSTPPTVTTLTSTDSDTIVSNSDIVTITATFSEAMAATPTISISGLVTNVTLSGSNTTWTYLWNVGSTSPTNGSYRATVAGSDLAGNAYAGTDSLTFTVSNSLADTTPPTVTLTSTDSDTIVSNSDIVTITATFSEAMAATPTISISGLVTNVTLSGSNTTWTYLWNVGSTSPTNGSYRATVAGSDLAGNAYAGTDSLTFTVSNSLADTTPPTVTLTSTDSDTIVSNSDIVTITATFSEAMAATPTISISGLVTNVTLSGSNTTWTYLWNVGSTSPTNGSYRATVAGSDLAGNAYAGTDSLTFTVSNSLADTTPPTVTTLTSTDSDTIVSNSDMVTITATFSEAMAATPTLSIAGLVINAAMSGSNMTWTYLWNVGSTSPTNGSYRATVAGSDLAGNAYAGTDSLTFTVSNSLADTTPPTVTTLTSTDSDTIVSNSDMVTITATFSEAMAATPTLSIAGLVINAAMSGSNTTWTYLWNVGSTSPTNGSYRATVAGSDLAGNAYAGTDSLTFTVSNSLADTTPPSITGPTAGSHSDLNLVENYTPVGSFAANESVSWTLMGIDRNEFQINSLGHLSFSGPKDFENPTDTNTDNRYEVIVMGTDGSNNTESHSVSVTLIDVNEIVLDTNPPLITGPSGQLGSSIAFNSNENISSLGTFQANEPVSWSLTGTDAGEFSITASGTLIFNSPPDFENPTDADSNNIYLLTVQATDGASNNTVMNITLTINDVNELSFNQIPGSGRYVYGIINPAFNAFLNPSSSQYMGTDPITSTYLQRNTSMGSFNNQTIIVRNSNIDLGSMYDQNVIKSPGQQMRYTGTVRNTATGASVSISGVVQGIQVYQVPPMGYLFHFKVDVIPDTPFGPPASSSSQWATGILQFYITY